MTPRLFIQIHRAAGSPTVTVGPFPNMNSIWGWCHHNGINHCSIVVPHRPDTTYTDLWGDPSELTPEEAL